MSVYGDWKAATISAGATKSAAVDLGRDYDYLEIQMPTMAACKLYLQVAETMGGTYYDLGKNVTTDEENFGRADIWKLGGHQFIKVAATKKQTSAVAIRVRGMRY